MIKNKISEEEAAQILLASGNPPIQVARMLSGKCTHIHYYDDGKQVYAKLKSIQSDINFEGRKINLLMCDVCHNLIIEYYTQWNDEKSTTVEIAVNQSWLDKAKEDDRRTIG